MVIQAATAEDLQRMKAALAAKEDWFQNVVGLPKDKAEWRWDIEIPNDFLANEARAADLTAECSGGPIIAQGAWRRSWKSQRGYERLSRQL